jgi:hypothetical protein
MRIVDYERRGTACHDDVAASPRREAAEDVEVVFGRRGM